MDNIALRVENLGKQYQIGELQKGYKTIRESIIDTICRPFQRVQGNNRSSSMKFWALNDVSFEVNESEVLGIIGHNGAGKTTLLKILARVTSPTQGRVELYGRVGSLLEVGTGFHPELTGRENIFLNGAIIGMKQVEIKRKFDEIVEFAEIEKFLDTPVKRYSSGMYVRLAFAVAAHLDPEILVVDEVLAVGDAAFQKKCIGKMGDVARGGRTVLLVSHNMGSVSQLCERVLWLDSGRTVKIGPTYEIIHNYLDTTVSKAGTWQNSTNYETLSEIRLLSASIINEEKIGTGIVRFDELFSIEIHYEVLERVRSWSLVLRVSDSSGTPVFTSWDTDSGGDKKPRESGKYRADCHIPSKFLRPGTYSVTLGTHFHNSRIFDVQEHLFNFEVSSVGYTMNADRWGVVTPLLDWSIERGSS